MKAFLLAAGRGTRMRPLTDATPKCMLPIDGKPIIGIWLDALAEAGVNEVLVNLHHLPKIVHNYVVAHADSSIKIHALYESNLYGSAGTLLSCRNWVADEEFFLVCYADGLTDFPLADLVSAHHERPPGVTATIATHRSRNPRAAGILGVDEDGIMTAFTEKPEIPVSDIANSGIYAFSPQVLDELPPLPFLPCDIGRDLLPRLAGRARAIPIPGYFRDIGTPESYEQAQREWSER
jgi:mannose-1-phosphate guanylyltransferase